MGGIAEAVSRRWWLLVFQGVLAVLFGAFAWVWPGLTVLTLVVLFGAFAAATGVLSLIAAYDARRSAHSPWGFLLQGLLGIGGGVLVAVWPGISALALLLVIAIWAIITGVYEVSIAIQLRKKFENEWLLALAGITAVVFGIVTVIVPGDGALALIWTIGTFAIIFGVLLIALGIRLHGAAHDLNATVPSGALPNQQG